MATIEVPLAIRVEEVQRLERALEAQGYFVVSRVGLTLFAQSKLEPLHALQVRALLTTTRFTFLRGGLERAPPSGGMDALPRRGAVETPSRRLLRRLPLRRLRWPLSDVRPEARDMTASLVGAGSGLVVVVDDDAMVAKAVTRLVAALGFEVLTVTNPLEVEAHLVRAPLAVLTDFHMPARGGLEVLRLARELAPGALRVLVSAAPPTASQLAAVAPLRLLGKPFSREELSEALTALP